MKITSELFITTQKIWVFILEHKKKKRCPDEFKDATQITVK
jgi:hypothetical protein